MKSKLTVQFENFSTWASSAWFCGESEVTTPPLKNLAVMSLGFAGESLEVLEAQLKMSRTLQENDKSVEYEEAYLLLLKELGDCVFYFCNIVPHFGLNLPEIVHNAEFLTSDVNLQAASTLESTMLSFLVKTGKITETIKKVIRDDNLDKLKLESLMVDWLSSWLTICSIIKSEPLLVLTLNQAKFNDRKNRGVLRGNGDNR